MTGFRIAALALPAAAAFLAPALWKWRSCWKEPAIGHAALLAVVLAWGAIAGAPASSLLAVAALATGFALFASGLYLAAGQVASGLSVVLLGATLFLAPSVVRESADRGRADQAQSRLDFLLAVNPWAVLAAGSFNVDLVRVPSIYRTHMADYVEARPPGWAGVAAGYAAAGLLLITAAMIARRLRKPKSDS